MTWYDAREHANSMPDDVVARAPSRTGKTTQMAMLLISRMYDGCDEHIHSELRMLSRDPVLEFIKELERVAVVRGYMIMVMPGHHAVIISDPKRPQCTHRVDFGWTGMHVISHDPVMCVDEAAKPPTN